MAFLRKIQVICGRKCGAILAGKNAGLCLLSGVLLPKKAPDPVWRGDLSSLSVTRGTLRQGNAFVADAFGTGCDDSDEGKENGTDEKADRTIWMQPHHKRNNHKRH